MTFVDKAGIKVSGIMKDGQDIFPDTRFYRFIIGADGNLYKAYYDPEDQQGDEAIISEIVNVKEELEHILQQMNGDHSMDILWK